MDTITVRIADDHKLLRETLTCLINAHPGFEVVASCENSEHAIERTMKEEPDIVLMDIIMKPLSGMEATQKIKAAFPISRVIGMSVHSDTAYPKNAENGRGGM